MQEIKPLLVFAHLLKHGTMHATAEALGMTPSAVSQHISKLESQHGVKLLNRSTRSLVPTEAGRELGVHCHKLLLAVNDTFSALENVKTEARGDVHIALPSAMINNPRFQKALKQLLQNYPEITPQLHFGDKLVDLQEGKIDIALRGGEHALDDPNIVAHHLIQSRYCLCAAQSYLRHHSISSPEDLRNQQWVYYQQDHFTMKKAHSLFQFKMENAIFCEQLLSQISLIKQGIAMGCVLEMDVAAELASGDLQILLTDWQLPPIDIYAVTPHRVQSAKVAVVLRLLKQEFNV